MIASVGKDYPLAAEFFIQASLNPSQIIGRYNRNEMAERNFTAGANVYRKAVWR
jgi:hypothetical protein